MENHGTVLKTRFKLMRERIEAMKEIWTQVKGRISRRHGQFRADDGLAKAGAKPHPPILVGGAFPQAARRAIRYGDGWCPLGGRPGANPLDALGQFRQMARDAGRNPQSLPVTLCNRAKRRRAARYRDLGIARVVVLLMSKENEQDPADPRPLGRIDPAHRLGSWASAGLAPA